MRFDYDNAAMDEVLKTLKFRKGLDNHLNRDACRTELRTLTSVGNAILHRPSDIVPGPQNEASDRIEGACVALQEALRKHKGDLLKRVGYTDGHIFDNDEDPMALLACLDSQLFSLWKLARSAEVVNRAGALSDGRRVEFLRECALFFKRWSAGKISSSTDSIFSRFASAVFSVMQIEKSADMRGSIERMRTSGGDRRKAGGAGLTVPRTSSLVY